LVRIRNRDDRTAWRDFDAIYRPILMRYALARGVDEATAEDVVQHCMTAVHRHVDGFDYDPARGRFKSWLRTIVNNRVRSLVRKHVERRLESGALGEPVHGDDSPDEAFERIWLQEHLRFCLEQLPASLDSTTVTAYHRYVIREEPVDVICADLGIKRSQLYKIKWQITARIRKRLQLLLDDTA